MLNVSVSNTSSVAAPSFFTHLVSTTIVSVVDVFSISQKPPNPVLITCPSCDAVITPVDVLYSGIKLKYEEGSVLYCKFVKEVPASTEVCVVPAIVLAHIPPLPVKPLTDVGITSAPQLKSINNFLNSVESKNSLVNVKGVASNILSIKYLSCINGLNALCNEGKAGKLAVPAEPSEISILPVQSTKGYFKTLVLLTPKAALYAKLLVDNEFDKGNPVVLLHEFFIETLL